MKPEQLGIQIATQICDGDIVKVSSRDTTLYHCEYHDD
jgi:hypothetical protein